MTPPPDAPRVLLVEDDEMLADLLSRYLEAHGHAVTHAGSVEDAEREVHKGFVPDIVVLDINLPGDSGWTLLRRGALGGAHAPPVVVTSAVPMSPARLHAFRVAGYLPKPFAPATLLSTIGRLLDERTAVP